MPFRLRALVAAVAIVVLGCTPLAAHPLGNFTINHLTKLAFGPQAVRVRYVLDMAEIPTYQALREVSLDGTLAPAAVERYGRERAAALLPQLLLTVDGSPASMTLDDAHARLRPGAGGLPTFYLTLDAHAPLAAHGGTRSIVYRDGTFAGRLGWHDVIVLPATEPTRELIAYPNALLGSPRATTAVQVALATNGRTRVHAEDDATPSQNGGIPSFGRSNQLSDMLRKGTSDWSFVLLTFLVAIVLGALHALEPGHGKTLLAVSLVGARATVKQAAILAGALTVAHTIGVLALGVAINLFKGYFVPENIYPWITLISGIAIAVIGARAVQKQLLNRRQPAFASAHVPANSPGLERAHHAHYAHGHESAHAHDHAPHAYGHEAEHTHDHAPHAHGHEAEHAHDHASHAHGHEAGHTHDHASHAHGHEAEHTHDHASHAHGHEAGYTHDHGHAPGHSQAPGHDHSHTHGHAQDADDLEHARSHAIPGSAPLKFGGTVWAAMSGGIAPCPAALVVLLAALAFNEVLYGIFVIVAFSVGLATTLTGLGIAVVRGAGWLQRRPQFDRFVRFGPLVSAAVISTIGAIMVGQGVAQQGVSISPIAITAAVALAILAYGFSRPLTRRQAELA